MQSSMYSPLFTIAVLRTAQEHGEEKRYDQQIPPFGEGRHENIEQPVCGPVIDEEQELRVQGLDGHDCRRC